jgi:hypothetical protein
MSRADHQWQIDEMREFESWLDSLPSSPWIYRRDYDNGNLEQGKPSPERSFEADQGRETGGDDR